MKELTEIESKKLEEYIVKTVHDDGHVEVNIDTKRMVDDLLGIESEDKKFTKINNNKENVITKITFVSPNGSTFDKHCENTIYLVNKTEEDVRNIFDNIIQSESIGKDGNFSPNAKMTIRAYEMREGKMYDEYNDFNGLRMVQGAKLIDGRQR